MPRCLCVSDMPGDIGHFRFPNKHDRSFAGEFGTTCSESPPDCVCDGTSPNCSSGCSCANKRSGSKKSAGRYLQHRHVVDDVGNVIDESTSATAVTFAIFPRYRGRLDFLRTGWIYSIHRIIPHIGIQVDPMVISHRIRLEEPPDTRRVVPCLVVVQPGFAVEALARVTEGGGAERSWLSEGGVPVGVFGITRGAIR